MQQKQTSIVIFDGSNFYHRVKRVLPGLPQSTYLYREFAQSITGDGNCTILFCVGELREDPADVYSKKLCAKQQRFFYHLEKNQIIIHKGTFIRNHGKIAEKGVDVRIAVEMMKGGFLNEYDTCYLISSDSDLLPAIQYVQSVGKKVIYVYFEGSTVSQALLKNCHGSVKVTREVIQEFAIKS